MTRIRTAIIPAAGLGIRMLPATEAVPKELFPVGGRPAIDWALDEAAMAGIEEVVIVSSPRKPAIEAYVAQTRNRAIGIAGEVGVAPSGGLKIRFVTQSKPQGLGDAVRLGWQCSGDQPVAVLLPDELMISGPALLASMLDHHDCHGASMVALMTVPLAEVGSYGCAQLAGPGPDGTIRLSRLVEKPDPVAAPSNFAICGRYLLGTDVLRALQRAELDPGVELQLTAALDVVASGAGMLGVAVLPHHGRADIGSWGGWLRANQRTLKTPDRPDDGTALVLMPPRHRHLSAAVA
jgi:UTP--glucose-1-phosphate uridylyltransferase